MRNIDASYLDHASWPDLDLESLPTKERPRYLKLKKAIIARIEGNKFVECHQKFGVSKPELQRQLRRCTQFHADGRLWGFRAISFHMHTRGTSIVKLYKNKKPGARGSFQLLIEKYPDIFEEIKGRFLGKKIGGKFRQVRMSIKVLHNLFLTRLREAGVSGKEYPFHEIDDLAYKSMCTHLRKVYQENVIAGAKERIGEDVARRLHSSMNQSKNKAIAYPYKKVLADGHRFHAFMTVEMPSPNGGTFLATIERPWVFLLMDECSRAIIGYYFSLNSEYNQVDVMQAVKCAFTPWKPKELTVRGLTYNPAGGLPNGVIPELARATWDEFWVDNGKANLAILVQEQLHSLAGCDINAGPVKMPERRSVIERLFRTLNECGFARLPSTTGSGPKDGRRKNPEKKAIEYKIMLHEAEELFDVIVADYNATPHSALFGRSPLEFLSNYLSKGNSIPIVSEERLNEFNFFTIRVKAKIRGGLKQARAPHVNYQGVTYTNDFLAQSPFMVNTSVLLLVNVDDLRQIKVYLEDGTNFGILTAHGAWGITPHTLKTRKAANKEIKAGGMKYFNTTDKIISMEKHFNAKYAETKSRKIASKCESLRRKRATSNPVKQSDVAMPESSHGKTEMSGNKTKDSDAYFNLKPGGFLR